MTKQNASKALTSEKFTGLKVKKIPTKAAGWPALFSSVRYVKNEVGVLKGMGALMKMNQKSGFDCSGCAWPDPDDHRSSLGEYCENGVKAFAEEATSKLLTPEFFKLNSVSEMAEWSDFQIGKSGRVTQPMIIEEGESHYKPIDWERAFEIIGDHLNKLESPDHSVFYTSGRTSNEAAFLYQLMVRKFGTNNLPDCSNMCHESSGVALTETLGIGKGSVTLDDFEKAEVIMVIGQNPGTNHPRMLTALQKAKKSGAKIISVNPLPEPGLIAFRNPQHLGDLLGNKTNLADLFLQVKINGDVALLKAIMFGLYKNEEKTGGVIDLDFIQSKTTGFEAFINSLLNYDYPKLIQESGVDENSVNQAVELLTKSKRIIVCWAMGLTQHVNGVNNIKEVVNLLLLKGSIGIPGGGTCPVRGHSNVQGDRTMGIWEKPGKAFLRALKMEFKFTPPEHHGLDTVEAIEAMHKGKATCFMGMGGNFLSATPDTDYVAQAMENCDLTVQVSTKLNRGHLVHGKTGIILPCLTRSEKDIQESGKQFVTVENSMGIVHSSQGVLNPPSEELKSEVSIICNLARSLFKEDSTIPWKEFESNYDLIRDRIESVIPGFENYNTRVRNDFGFYLPNCSRSGEFHNGKGKAIFSKVDLPQNKIEKDELILMTIRSHDQYNTTIYGLNDRYRGVFNERRVVFMNKNDMKSRGISTSDIVNLESNYKDKTRRANNFIALEFDVPKGCCACYFPEANVLIPINHTAAKSNTPASKFVAVKISMAK